MTTGGSQFKPGMATPVKVLPSQPAKTENIHTLDEIDPVAGRTEALFYGDPGTWKSVTASTFPGPFRWIDADRGLKSVVWAVRAGKSSITDPKQLVFFQPTPPKGGSYGEIAESFDLMTDVVDHWFSPGQVELWEGGTLVIDSMTTINEWSLVKGLSLNAKKPSEAKPLSTSHRINLDVGARIVTGEQDYKSAQAFITTFLDDTRIKCTQFRRNLVVICHTWTDTDDDGHVLKYKPLLIGQLRERFGKDFDDIWYFESIGGTGSQQVHVLLTPGPRHIAKTRWGDIFPAKVPPDYREVIRMVRDFHERGISHKGKL